MQAKLRNQSALLLVNSYPEGHKAAEPELLEADEQAAEGEGEWSKHGLEADKLSSLTGLFTSENMSTLRGPLATDALFFLNEVHHSSLASRHFCSLAEEKGGKGRQNLGDEDPLHVNCDLSPFPCLSTILLAS